MLLLHGLLHRHRLRRRLRLFHRQVGALAPTIGAPGLSIGRLHHGLLQQHRLLHLPRHHHRLHLQHQLGDLLRTLGLAWFRLGQCPGPRPLLLARHLPTLVRGSPACILIQAHLASLHHGSLHKLITPLLHRPCMLHHRRLPMPRRCTRRCPLLWVLMALRHRSLIILEATTRHTPCTRLLLHRHHLRQYLLRQLHRLPLLRAGTKLRFYRP